MTRPDRSSARRVGPDERAVSEVIGFALTFSIIILSVGLLTVGGFTALEDFSDGEQLQNAERAFDALAEHGNEIQRNDGVSERSMQIQLRDGQLGFRDGPTLAIDDGTDNLLDDELDLTLGSMAYEQSNSVIAYEGGAVVREQGLDDFSFPVREAKLTCRSESAHGDDVALITLTKIDADDSLAAGDSVREISMQKVESETHHTSEQVSLSIQVEDAPGPEAWDAMFERNGFDGGDGAFSCDADRATIRITTIEIEHRGQV